jgi:hypothetical protein
MIGVSMQNRALVDSLLVGFYKYTEDQTKRKSLIFKGSKISHKSEDFKCTGYSLVFLNKILFFE